VVARSYDEVLENEVVEKMAVEVMMEVAFLELQVCHV
jgi:hypothetical protein